MPEETSESALERMRTEWDARARENAFHYVASSRETWTADEFYASGRESVDAHILKDAARLFRRGDPKQLTMLEIGCGAGRMTRALAATFGEVHAVDISAEMIAKAGEALADCKNVSLYQTNGTDLGELPDVRFDFAFSFIVFQHIPDRAVIARYVNDVANRLQPGGVFKFQVQGHWRSSREAHDSWLGCTITARDALRIAEDAGLWISAHEGVGTDYFWLWLTKPSALSAESQSPEVDAEATLSRRLREVEMMRQDAEQRLARSEHLQNEREMLAAEIEHANRWALDLDNEIAALIADRDKLIELSRNHEQEIEQLKRDYESVAGELDEAKTWASSLDSQTAALRKHLQQLYASVGYRLARRLKLAPGPIHED